MKDELARPMTLNYLATFHPEIKKNTQPPMNLHSYLFLDKLKSTQKILLRMKNASLFFSWFIQLLNI